MYIDSIGCVAVVSLPRARETGGTKGARSTRGARTVRSARRVRSTRSVGSARSE